MLDETPCPETLEILYQDDHYVAVHKPSGLLVHRSPIDREETRFCLQILRDQLGRLVHPCHRLDKPTSGIVLFALDAEALQLANRLLAEKEVEKTYLALVRGWVEESGIIDHSLQRIDVSWKRVGPSQEAVTHYRSLQQFHVDIPVDPYPSSRYSLVELKPETGRTHQLRRHMKHISHPIIGDTKHGDGRHNLAFREHFGCYRLMLAATRLVIPNPFTGALIDIHCPPEPSFQNVVNQLSLPA